MKLEQLFERLSCPCAHPITHKWQNMALSASKGIQTQRHEDSKPQREIEKLITSSFVT